MTQIGYYFDQSRCTGCYTCSVACKDWHNIDAGPVSWMQVRLIENGKFPDIFVAYLCSPCYQCINPLCVLACPVNAITKREFDGIVVVDREKCLGNNKCRRLCLNACPWQAPQFGLEENAKMQKCDFCLERLRSDQQPICVEACPLYALDIGYLYELKAKYGDVVEAYGFHNSVRCKPAVIFKPKLRHCDNSA